MKAIFRNTMLAILAIISVGKLVSMLHIAQGASNLPIITRISNHMENQKAVITFNSRLLDWVLLKGGEDFFFASSDFAQEPQNEIHERIAENKGFPLFKIQHMTISLSTPTGVAKIVAGPEQATMADFIPFSGESIRSYIQAKKIRIIIDSNGYIILADDEANPAKLQ